jgi:pimeloyl-ACP methyl ester carboxylesterase
MHPVTIAIASNVGPARIDIAYERLGDPSAPPVLLVMGLGAQLVQWPDEFCDALVQRGLHVIRFDNRDVGQSTRFRGTPNFMAALAGDLSSAVYTLSDMAGDTVGLLDELGIASAHLVGASLGGFIAQTMAIEHPQRVQTLTSMLSSTGNRAVGQSHVETAGLFTRPLPATRAEAIERAYEVAGIIGSPGHPLDRESVADRAGRAYDRGIDMLSYLRQGVAAIASGDRTERLGHIRVPALVIHGASDPLVDVSGGRATAEAIPGAELVVYDGMGHDLPKALWPQITDRIAALIARTDCSDSRPGATDRIEQGLGAAMPVPTHDYIAHGWGHARRRPRALREAP